MTDTQKRAPSDASEKFMLRFHDDGMRQHIKESAARNERSMNAEIIYLIKCGQQSISNGNQSKAS